MPGIDFNVGGGETMPGMDASFSVGGGETMPGIERAFWTDNGCVEGAAAALSADRARAEPRATHETFNHDECILDSPQQLQREPAGKTNRNVGLRYNKSTEGT